MLTVETRSVDVKPKPASPPSPLSVEGEVRKCALHEMLFAAYRWERLRRIALSAALKFEGSDFYSGTARRILAHYHGVEIGAYSYGSCFVPGAFDPGVVVGRYTSIVPGVRAFQRNHPSDRLSMHPFFYNASLGFIEKDVVDRGTLVIGHDAWMGANSIVTPGCSYIGVGAVVGAGAIVTKNVDDFAVVVGNPARLVRYRFPESTRRTILESRWWERSIEDCAPFMDYMARPVPNRPAEHPLLQSR